MSFGIGNNADYTQQLANDKKKYEYTNGTESRKVITKPVASSIYTAAAETRKTLAAYGKTNMSIGFSSGSGPIDQVYDYKNENKAKNSPVATDYYIYTNASSHDVKVKGFMTTQASVTAQRGQVQTNGDSVPIGNTFNAFMTNNNPATTATINNTTPAKLAHNIMGTLDNIQTGDAPGVVRVEENFNGKTQTSLIAPNKENPFDFTTKQINPRTELKNDGVINNEEIEEGMACYAFAAKELTMKNALAETPTGEDPLKRLKSAGTVDLDDNDPYKAFYKKAGSIDGQPGVTEAELTQAIDEISDKSSLDKSGNQTLTFNKEKLNLFLAKKFPAPSDSSSSAGTSTQKAP